TPDLLVRSQTLYPTELRARGKCISIIADANVAGYSHSAPAFASPPRPRRRRQEMVCLNRGRVPAPNPPSLSPSPSCLALSFSSWEHDFPRMAHAPSRTLAADLNHPLALSPGQIAFYRENGYIKLHGVLAPELIARYRPEIMEQIRQLHPKQLEQRSTYDKAFLQLTNLWTRSPAVREFVFGKRLASLAAQLMGCRGVRLWHDQALFKEAGGGF